MESRVAPFFDKVVCNDAHQYLIALLQGVQNGYELPDCISEEQYEYVKSHKDEDKVLTGFVGFGSSFGGKFFGGYGRSVKYDLQKRSHALESKHALLRDNERLKNAAVICRDYRDVELPAGCVIYADPPYDGTTQYGGLPFDSEAFWRYARAVSKDHIMFISEMSAPADFVSIWEQPVKRTLDKDKSNQFTATEKLFIHKCNLPFLRTEEPAAVKG